MPTNVAMLILNNSSVAGYSIGCGQCSWQILVPYSKAFESLMSRSKARLSGRDVDLAAELVRCSMIRLAYDYSLQLGGTFSLSTTPYYSTGLRRDCNWSRDLSQSVRGSAIRLYYTTVHMVHVRAETYKFVFHVIMRPRHDAVLSRSKWAKNKRAGAPLLLYACRLARVVHKLAQER